MDMFQSFLDYLAPGWVGSLIGIIGVLAAVVTYFLTRQRSILAYRTSNIHLLGHSEGNLPEDVQVYFQGAIIPRLTKSILILWNYGEKTIDGSSITVGDSLRIKLPESVQILSISVSKCTRDVIGVKTRVSDEHKHIAYIDFDFLDSGDGVVFEVLHTGDDKNFDICGTIKGMPNGLKDFGRVFNGKLKDLKFPIDTHQVAWASFLTGLLVTLLAIFYPNFTLFPFDGSIKVDQTVSAKSPRGAMILAGLLYTFLGAFLLNALRRRYPKSLIIDGFD